MIIHIQDKELEFVRPILRRVAKRYRDLMIHREVMSGKLQELRIHVTQGKDCLSFYRMNRMPGAISHFIQLNVAPGESAQNIAFTFAHELSHMLLSGSGDYVNSMIDNAVIPKCLEESMADVMADFVVSHCRFAKDPLLMLLREVDGYCSKFARLLASGFGLPLEEAEFFDDFSLERIEAEDAEPTESEEINSDAFWKTYFAPADASCPAELWIHNDFWYYSVLGKFNRIPEIFDAYMGEGAFETVCDKMDAYHCAVRDGVGANYVQRCLKDQKVFQDEAEQAKQHAFDLVQQFVDIRAKERESY